ncbi:hypothetical protein DFH08DRAFT_815113 [Mycena albidolilacea]|uniref:Uncharacterized protein n=1 Tax=Mycena albidolilacea TaxID=1033008 RepID=A0AAD7EBB4_9AGAR|nr:hypothetical protein DFH08DRAFT_823542 [Mycena albidolilacea]KAJ7331032.1 hypothetical protein DFH08DRAFT_815113 [Mycena albidolilacea]
MFPTALRFLVTSQVAPSILFVSLGLFARLTGFLSSSMFPSALRFNWTGIAAFQTESELAGNGRAGVACGVAWLVLDYTKLPHCLCLLLDYGALNIAINPVTAIDRINNFPDLEVCPSDTGFLNPTIPSKSYTADP